MLNYNIKFSKLLILIGLIFYLSAIAPTFVFSQNDWSLPLKKCWTIENRSGDILASDNESKHIILYSQTEIKLLNSESGNVNWQTSISGTLIGDSVVYEQNIFYIAESNDKKVFLNSINIESGLLNWRTYVPLAYKLLVGKDNLFLLGDEGKQIYKVDRFDGKILTLDTFQSKINLVLPFDSKIIAFKSDSTFSIISSSNNEKDKILGNFSGSINNAIYISSGNFIWTNSHNEIGNYSSNYQENSWIRKIGGKITSLRFSENILFVTSLDNFVYLFDINDGELLLKKRLDGRIVKSSFVFDRKIIVSAYNSSLVYIFDLKNVSNINLITLSDADFADGFGFSDNKLIISTPGKIYAYSPSCK